MSTYTTPAALGTPWPDGSMRPTRMRSTIVALLACIPLPLLSVGAMLLPIPELAQRAAATFAPIAPFLDDPGEQVVRQRAEASPLRIRPAPGEPAPIVTVEASATKAPERRAGPSAAHSVNAGKAAPEKLHSPTTTSAPPARTHVLDERSDPGPSTESPQPPVSPKAPGEDAAAPASTAPNVTAPEPPQSGGSGKSGSSSSTTGGGGSSVGTGGETTEPQPPGGGSSSSPGAGAGGEGQGGGSGSAAGSPPDHAGSSGAPASPSTGPGTKGGGKP